MAKLFIGYNLEDSVAQDKGHGLGVAQVGRGRGSGWRGGSLAQQEGR